MARGSSRLRADRPFRTRRPPSSTPRATRPAQFSPSPTRTSIPGAVRLDPLFFVTYGKTAREVQAALVRVGIAHKFVVVHRKIAEPLRRVATRIDVAMKADPSLARFFESLGGTWNWRTIAGTNELSMHSWAIAIDLDTTRASYWHNETHDERAPLEWKNRYPQAIVDAFEAEGFIWGGRWYHFDTMHFEYRPELLDPSCYP